jgi:xanthine dehydrogenase YagS FAD-binding subunit
MNVFGFEQARSIADAVRMLAAHPDAKYLAGGTNLVDLMREGIERPEMLVDVSALSDEIEVFDDRLIIGAGVRNTDLVAHPMVRERFPMLVRAVLAGASPQIRNMASVGGNILQRTRCSYFYDGASRCNKRRPGAGCDALEGFNRYHAILGASPSCVATHPSDMCVALAALDADVQLLGPGGTRAVKLVDFHRLPGGRPDLDTVIEPGELITGVELTNLPSARRSTYRKVRDRASYAFALVSIAAALSLSEDGKVDDVRVALGGVAAKPWRSRIFEEALKGQQANEASLREAAEAELAGASGLSGNAFKIELAKRLLVSTLQDLSQKDFS